VFIDSHRSSFPELDAARAFNALTQQIQARPAHFRTVGRVLLGLEPDHAVL
jgi:hypothetical protein